MLEAMRAEADQQRKRARAHERGGGDGADLQRRVSQLDEIDRQQQAHEAVGKGAQALGGEQSRDG